MQNVNLLIYIDMHWNHQTEVQKLMADITRKGDLNYVHLKFYTV